MFLCAGLIECNINIGKLKDAANAAKEMVELFPRSAEACYMLGKVLSRAKGDEGVNAVSNFNINFSSQPGIIFFTNKIIK